MHNRWDETWHRLREWTNGQAAAERLAAQILYSEGFQGLDPSHPLGGPDGGKDGLCRRDGNRWVMAVYFPRGKKIFGAIKKKLLRDLGGVHSNKADALVFVTNQELTLQERSELTNVAQPVPVELYHLERITAILDKPDMARVRKQFLGIDFDPAGGTLKDTLDVFFGVGRNEHEIQDAIVTLSARKAELLTHGVEPGKSRCTTCGSSNAQRSYGDYNGRSVDVTICEDCGEFIDVCS